MCLITLTSFSVDERFGDFLLVLTLIATYFSSSHCHLRVVSHVSALFGEHHTEIGPWQARLLTWPHSLALWQLDIFHLVFDPNRSDRSARGCILVVFLLQ
jgi:hypothetical protein